MAKKNIYASALASEVATNQEKNVTPQCKAIPGREAEMQTNNAGGVTFVLDKWAQFDRFLIMGTEGGNYYTSQK